MNRLAAPNGGRGEGWAVEDGACTNSQPRILGSAYCFSISHVNCDELLQPHVMLKQCKISGLQAYKGLLSTTSAFLHMLLGGQPPVLGIEPY